MTGRHGCSCIHQVVIRAAVTVRFFKILQERRWRMTPADLLTALSIKIYEPPLSEMREDCRICDLSDPVAVLMLVIDFETEVSMSGINIFLGNSSGQYAHETVVALQTIGAQTQAILLQKILIVAANAGMTHDAIQADRSGLEEFSITSFQKLHGDKWDAASHEIQEIEAVIDYTEMMSCAESYVERYRAQIHQALGISLD
jgi:hypothetical protein